MGARVRASTHHGDDMHAWPGSPTRGTRSQAYRKIMLVSGARGAATAARGVPHAAACRMSHATSSLRVMATAEVKTVGRAYSAPGGEGAMRGKVLVLAGTTGVGKTAVALELAQMLDGEVVNADSVQVRTPSEAGAPACALCGAPCLGFEPTPIHGRPLL